MHSTGALAQIFKKEVLLIGIYKGPGVGVGKWGEVGQGYKLPAIR